MNKRHLVFFMPIICILFLGFNLPPQSQDTVLITFTADRSELTVGDVVTLLLEIRHPAGNEVVIPHLAQNWGDFEVRSQSSPETTPNPDGSETTRQTITVTLFSPGTYQTPPLPITVYDGSGGIIEKNAPSISLKVVSVLVAGDTELRDIKPQAKLKIPFPWSWLLSGLILAAAACGGMFWYTRRRKDENSSRTPIEVDDRPPHEIALDELARIAGLKLPEQKRFKEHYTLVSDCLRRYLEEQIRIRTLDRTTYELNRDLKRSDLPRDVIQNFIAIFRESDLVKFARYTPDVDAAHNCTREARLLVEATMPPPEIISPESSEAP
ncbi:MAG: BatD family protein [Anaerolineaceae bacterium]|nr:BatD family protein [Anaerolineaceae bacterium]